MAFKSLKEFNSQRFDNLFLLRNNGDSADVIFLYQSFDDVLVADVHYIKSNDYTGYVHCCGSGCPACAKGIRVQTKLFIPLYNITNNRIEFWDRSIRFENQLESDVFRRFPNPSEIVFRITRNGESGDVNTTYKIVGVGRNSQKSFQDILLENDVAFPEYYETICKTVDASSLDKMVNISNVSSTDNSNDGYTPLVDYKISPRVPSTVSTDLPEYSDDSQLPFDMNSDSDESSGDGVQF